MATNIFHNKDPLVSSIKNTIFLLLKSVETGPFCIVDFGKVSRDSILKAKEFPNKESNKKHTLSSAINMMPE